MATYRIVMWTLAGAAMLLHLVLVFRSRGRDWTTLNVMLPAMFIVMSRPRLATASLGVWFGIGMAALYAVGIVYCRAIRGVEWQKLLGLLIGTGESAMLAAACGWGTLFLPSGA